MLKYEQLSPEITEKIESDRVNNTLPQLAFDEKLKLTYSGNAIHIRIKIASYPVSKENAIEVAKKLFNFL